MKSLYEVRICAMAAGSPVQGLVIAENEVEAAAKLLASIPYWEWRFYDDVLVKHIYDSSMLGDAVESALIALRDDLPTEVDEAKLRLKTAVGSWHMKQARKERAFASMNLEQVQVEAETLHKKYVPFSVEVTCEFDAVHSTIYAFDNESAAEYAKARVQRIRGEVVFGEYAQTQNAGGVTHTVPSYHVLNQFGVDLGEVLEDGIEEEPVEAYRIEDCNGVWYAGTTGALEWVPEMNIGDRIDVVLVYESALPDDCFLDD